jgi:hypothetical protein
MLTFLSKNAFFRILCTIMLFLMLVGLPLTSFPIISNMTGAIVAPFSALPLVLLILIWLVPYLLERGKFPAEVIPYLYFVLIALVVSALGFFLNGYYARGKDFFDQNLRAFITITIGLGFYLTLSAYFNNEKEMRRALLFIYIGGGLLIGWTLIEVVLQRTFDRVQDFPQWVHVLRSTLAKQSPNIIYTNRVTGFAYEPSWFVRQFNLVLFPIWLSAVFQRKSPFKFRIWLIQIEDILLIAGLIVFGFSSPRVGLVAFLASLAFLAFLLLQKIHQLITSWYLKRRKRQPKRLVFVKLLLAFMLFVILAVIVSSALVGYILVASRWDDRFQLLFDDSRMSKIALFPISEDRLIQSSEQLAFMERMIFWFGGWNIFNDYPFGVGLGNAGFYFYERMNFAGYKSVEIRDLLYRANYLPNTKNLWTRLLAETGFIGLAVFLIWLYILWRSSALMRKSQSTVLRIMGLAGQLFLLAYLVEGFSMDSFAMPYQWVMAGLISAGGLIARREFSARDKHEVPLSAPV